VHDAPHYAHCGHSAHVVCVRWDADGDKAVSVGGRDRAVFIWRLARSEAKDRTETLSLDVGIDEGQFWRPSPVAIRGSQSSKVAVVYKREVPGHSAWR
jgi:echinoderm microtubule-associated protein-like 6